MKNMCSRYGKTWNVLNRFTVHHLNCRITTDAKGYTVSQMLSGSIKIRTPLEKLSKKQEDWLGPGGNTQRPTLTISSQGCPCIGLFKGAELSGCVYENLLHWLT